MSPRSDEFIDQARERLIAAREAFDTGHSAVAVSVAYYAMLNRGLTLADWPSGQPDR
jgi:uncharacterized protein (UPF0332 family)